MQQPITQTRHRHRRLGPPEGMTVVYSERCLARGEWTGEWAVLPIDEHIADKRETLAAYWQVLGDATEDEIAASLLTGNRVHVAIKMLGNRIAALEAVTRRRAPAMAASRCRVVRSVPRSRRSRRTRRSSASTADPEPEPPRSRRSSTGGAS